MKSRALDMRIDLFIFVVVLPFLIVGAFLQGRPFLC